jgi:hypothetical protein
MTATNRHSVIPVQAGIHATPGLLDSRLRGDDDILDALTVPPLPGDFAVRVMAKARRRASPVASRKPLFLGWWRLQWGFDLSVPMRVAACGVVFLASLVGMLMSKEVSPSGNLRTTVPEAESLDGFEWFSLTPPESLGSAYLALALPALEDEGAR